MFGLRQKLLLGFAGLLIVLVVIGVQGITRINDLGQSIDVILRENYRSVIACQDMKESLERVDSTVLFVLLGYEKEGKAQIVEHLGRFDKALRLEQGNITLPGEEEAVRQLVSVYGQYRGTLQEILDSRQSVEERRTVYFRRLLPLFYEVKQNADRILQLNQQNMSDTNMLAREKAARASQRMYLLLLSGTGIAIAFMLFTRRWILGPITGLIDSANEIARGNLDLVVRSTSRDEIGQLSQAFNTMAERLREFRRSNEARVIRIQRATQKAFDSLPDAIALVDPEGTVEVATPIAKETFDLIPGAKAPQEAYPWMATVIDAAFETGRPARLPDADALVQVFVRGEERFFRPEAIPILDAQSQPTGVTLVLQDVTQLRDHDELKRGLVSTVSHQLKTPLTSIRMALYLLLDEKLGPLTAKQEEIVLAARDDSDRLHNIVENLLDIARIRAGRAAIECHPVPAALLAAESVELFRAEAQDRGITLVSALPENLPEVYADRGRISHAFGNLLSNALKYTAPGGQVTIAAREEGGYVWYSVNDTGCGIEEEHLARVFEQFFRAPEQSAATGAGLGLAIAKEIVEAHGGQMRAESRRGKGSTFSFSLKRADATPRRDAES